MSEQSIFDFGKGNICKPDADGKYREYFYARAGEDSVTEVEAIRQWLCGYDPDLSPMLKANWKYIERLVELAEGK